VVRTAQIRGPEGRLMSERCSIFTSDQLGMVSYPALASLSRSQWPNPARRCRLSAQSRRALEEAYIAGRDDAASSAETTS
jgi:hypothetical protein